jgi:hypothetical protein
MEPDILCRFRSWHSFSVMLDDDRPRNVTGSALATAPMPGATADALGAALSVKSMPRLRSIGAPMGRPLHLIPYIESMVLHPLLL